MQSVNPLATLGGTTAAGSGHLKFFCPEVRPAISVLAYSNVVANHHMTCAKTGPRCEKIMKSRDCLWASMREAVPKTSEKTTMRVAIARTPTFEDKIVLQAI